VYQESPTTRDNMKLRIRNVFQSITPQMLANVHASFQNRIRECVEQNGRQFEHLFH
jgi:hypothetical protein